MSNSIKSKVLGVRERRIILVFLLVIIILTMVACDGIKPQVTTYEYELVSCYVEIRNLTNLYGGTIQTNKYVHFSYIIGNGNVKSQEKQIGDFTYFQITDGTPKLPITTGFGDASYTFQLTREMYNKLYSG